MSCWNVVSFSDFGPSDWAISGLGLNALRRRTVALTALTRPALPDAWERGCGLVLAHMHISACSHRRPRPRPTVRGHPALTGTTHRENPHRL